MASILNILSTRFYVFEEINRRWCRHNTVPLSLIRTGVPWMTAPVRRP